MWGNFKKHIQLPFRKALEEGYKEKSEKNEVHILCSKTLTNDLGI